MNRIFKFRCLTWLGIVTLAFFASSCKDKGLVSVENPRPNVILILIDTLRADHLACYGYHRTTSPHIDNLAKEGILFKNMLANTSWTRPGTASILSGLYPKNHRAITPKDNLAEEINLISEILSSHNYTSFAFVANHHVGKKAGFDQGYKNFISFTENKDKQYLKLTVSSEKMNHQVLKVIENLKFTSNNFFYIHYMDPHAPYTPPEKYFSKSNDMVFSQKKIQSLIRPPENPDLRKQVTREMINAYDDEILFNDKMVGRLIAALKKKEMFSNSIIIITSDHGEEFYEHGSTSHGKTLYNEQLRIPLIIRLPDSTHQVMQQTANQVDILPTILSLLKIPVPTNIDGFDLLDERSPARKYSFAELNRYQYVFSSIQSAEEKFISGLLPNLMKIDSLWFKEAAAIETEENSIQLIIRSYNKKRTIQIFCDFKQINELEITPQKQTFSIPLPSSKNKKRIIIRSLTPCQVPREINMGTDSRCLGFRIFKSKNVDRNNLLGEPSIKYFCLSGDRLEQNDQSKTLSFQARIRLLTNNLQKYKKNKMNLKLTRKPVIFDNKQKRALKSLGYIQN